MGIKLYNTMTGRKEEFVPVRDGEVSMYVCGPTVYNLIHIGNARPMIVFDTVRRYFEYRGFRVNYVSNFTDVDDKIIKRALEENREAAEVSEQYIAECKKDMEALHVRPATVHPQATKEIDGMVDMISTLLKKDYAYVASDGTVYYRISRFKEYGKLSHKDLDRMQSGFRELKVTGEEQKEDPLDFVLWKPKKEGEPSWPSPWCDGRPGWHIECSVMARRYLGDTIDIHAGGEDLIFPHHENEIAQSEAANGCTFAKYWMHNAFLNIDNVKMSKSAGNFFTVRDILAQVEPQVVRYFMLSVHYRSPLNFSKEIIEAAGNGLERIVNCGRNLTYLQSVTKTKQMTAAEEAALSETQAFQEAFEKAMDDDFNTADALAALFELVKWTNLHASENSSAEFLKQIAEQLNTLADVLGLVVFPEEEKDEEAEEIEALIAKRQQARKEKDFATADAIRDELSARGIALEDTREGVKWKRA